MGAPDACADGGSAQPSPIARPKVIEFRSDYSETVLYACSLCGMVHQGNTREQAERCCTCARCGKPVEKRFHTMCDEHEAEHYAEKAARRRATSMGRPVVEDHVGPVYVDDTGRFYETADEAAEALWDEGKDPTTALVLPCSASPAPVPDLVTYVDEAWGEEFDDGWDGLDADSKKILDACMRALAEHAPIVWHPLTEKRVELPAVTMDNDEATDAAV